MTEQPAAGAADAASFASTDDKRTENNTMRHSYRKLSGEEMALVTGIKDLGEQFLEQVRLVHLIKHPHREPGLAFWSDDLRIARMKVKEAVMWTVNEITS